MTKSYFVFHFADNAIPNPRVVDVNDKHCRGLCGGVTNGCCDVLARCTCHVDTGRFGCLCPSNYIGNGLDGNCSCKFIIILFIYLECNFFNDYKIQGAKIRVWCPVKTWRESLPSSMVKINTKCSVPQFHGSCFVSSACYCWAVDNIFKAILKCKWIWMVQLKP